MKHPCHNNHSVTDQNPSHNATCLCVSLNDFDDLATFFTGWQGRFEQISAGKFAGHLQLVEGRMLKLVAVQFNQVILARGYRETGFVSLYPVTPHNADGIWHGRTLSPGRLVLHGTNAETNHLSARLCQTLGITVQENQMQHAARVLLNSDENLLPSTWANMQPSPKQYQNCMVQFHTLMQLGLSVPAMLTSDEWSQREQECLRVFFDSLVVDSAHQKKESLHRRTAIVRSAEELMRSSLHQPLGVVDLCSSLGVSDRTMRLAFLEHYGMGTMTYYRTLRLNAVRAELKANPQHSVAQTANNYSFYHLGHFSARYRRLFGEVPSAIHRTGDE